MSSQKRKKADTRPTRDKTERAPQQQKLDKPASPAYDIHRTYRVRRVPVELDNARLRSTLGELTRLNPTDVQVRSLASDFDHDSNTCLRTATVTFNAVPQFKGERLNTTDLRSYRWHLPLPGTEHDHLVVDTIFDGLTPLSPWENNDKHTIDLYLIHGFGSHAMGAFLANGSSYMWARDTLTKRIPQLRVWTYGYYSKLTDATSIATTLDWAERFRSHLRINRKSSKANEEGLPIIYLAHSLGGLIWREAMTRMGESTRKEDLDNLRCSYGALLFGVPHQGMNTSNLMTMVDGLGPELSLRSLEEKVDSLQRHRSNNNFNKAFNSSDSRMEYFYETRESRTMRLDKDEGRWVRSDEHILLVRPESATNGANGDCCHSLEADHSGLVKFSMSDPDNSIQVLDVLETFAHDAPNVISRRTGIAQRDDHGQSTEPPKELGNLPPSLNNEFYGRTDVLATMFECLLQKKRQVPADIPAFTIVGTGGVGKTQLARRFIDLNVRKFEHIIWIHSDAKLKLASEFEHVAHLLELANDNTKPDACREKVQEWLRTHDKWILVFDNVEDLPIDSLYWPSNLGIGGCIILTSRHPDVRPHPSTGHIDLDCFSEGEATNLFLDQTGLSATCDNQTRELARQIAWDRLRGHPLFMSHLAGYMVVSDCTLWDLLTQYDVSERDVIECEENTKPNYYYGGRAAATVWSMSIKNLQRPARKLLDLFAFLDPDWIPVELSNAVDSGGLQTALHVNSQKKALRQLSRQSLIKLQDEASVIHRLLLDAVRRAWEASDWQRSFEMAATCLHAVYPKQVLGDSMVDVYAICKAYEAHVLSVLKWYKKAQWMDPEKNITLVPPTEFVEVLAHSGWFFFERGQLVTAQEILETARAMCVAGSERIEPLTHALVCNNLAAVNTAHGHSEEAGECLEITIAHRERYLSRDDPQIQELAIAYCNYANNLSSRNQASEAEQFYSKALQIRKECPGSTPEGLGLTLYNCGYFHYTQGHLDQAQELIGQALAQHRETGRPSSFLLYAEYCQGNIHCAKGDIRTGLAVHETCLTGRRKLEGDDHYMTAVSKHKVGSLHLQLGEVEAGVALLDQAIKSFRSSQSIHGGLLPRSCLHLGKFLLDSGKSRGDEDATAKGALLWNEGIEAARRHRGSIFEPEGKDYDYFNQLVKRTHR